MRLALVLLLLAAAAAAACTEETVYAACRANPVCLGALWQPTAAQFGRVARAIGLNCSSPAPELELAARARTRYACNPGEYGALDDAGTFRCRCPAESECGVPSNQNTVLALLSAFAAALLFGVVFHSG